MSRAINYSTLTQGGALRRSTSSRETIQSGDNVMRKVSNIRVLPAALLLAFAPLLATAAARPPQNNAITNTCIGQNFDSVSAPTLPGGWTSSVVGGAPTTAPWITRSVGYADSGTNAAFADDANDYADTSLYSKTYSVTSADIPYVVFRHSYVLWSPDPSSLNNGAFNGAVFEISINGGAFVDLTAAGGSFYTGGYTAHLDTTYENPIDQPPVGRAVWSGDSGGFVTTTAIIPASAAGQQIQFRWRLGTSGGSRSYDTHSGWWVDTLETQALATVSDYVFTDGFEGGNCTP